MEVTTQFAVDISKKRLRASTIMGQGFRPHAYIPMSIDIEKIKEKIKEMGFEGELPEVPENAELRSMAMVPFNLDDEGLHNLGHLLSMTDVAEIIVVCDTTVKSGGKDVDVLCVANVNLKAPDTMVLLPYEAGANDDVAFGEESVKSAVTESIRDGIIEGFLMTESNKFVVKNPDGDTDSYVDSLPTQYPNVEGALNKED
jgi:hypothetical protein